MGVVTFPRVSDARAGPAHVMSRSGSSDSRLRLVPFRNKHRNIGHQVVMDSLLAGISGTAINVPDDISFHAS